MDRDSDDSENSIHSNQVVGLKRNKIVAKFLEI
jgi:hypothetical protein